MAARRSRCALLVGALAGCLALACGEQEHHIGDTDVGIMDTGGGGQNPSSGWTVNTVEERGIGTQARIAVSPSDELAIAYFKLPYEAGRCEDIDVEGDPPARLQYDLTVASKPSGGSWSIEVVDSPEFTIGPRGIGLAYTSAGDLMLAYSGGEPDPDGEFCLSGDAYLATRSGGAWTTEAASTESGDSPGGEAESQAGYIVGFWPALAIDADGQPAIVHQDVHFLHAGENRNDAEFAWRQGGWTNELVDGGTGAGDGSALIFDSQNRPIAFYFTPVAGPNQGVWASRRNDAGEWERIKIHDGAIRDRISATLDPEFGEPVAAMYAAGSSQVKVVRLLDDDRFLESDAWVSEMVGNTLYEEGTHVSLAFTPSGDMALAYYRCMRYDPESDDCVPGDDGVVFALKKGAEWEYQLVDDGASSGTCGTYTSLAFTSDGTAHIAYQCTENTLGEFYFSLFVATKKIE